MALSEYEVVINGMTTTVRLSESDAKKRGLTKKAAPVPQNKARSADNK